MAEDAQSIERKTKEFLEKGGKIQYIPRGLSGDKTVFKYGRAKHRKAWSIRVQK